MPSFRSRRVGTPFISTPVSAVAPAPPLFSLIDEDDEVHPHDTNLRPRKRKVVDIGGGVPSAIESLEDEFVIWKTMTIHIEDDVGDTSEAPQFEETNVDMTLHPEEEKVTEGAIGDSFMPLGQMRPLLLGHQGMLILVKGIKAKVLSARETSRVDMDLDDLKMIDEGTTQIEVRTERGVQGLLQFPRIVIC